MSLSTVLEEIKRNKPQAEMDITLGSPQTERGRIGLKKAATAAIERLRIQYRNELLSTTAFIVVTGSSRDKFAELASGEAFNCFSVDPNDFYKEMVSKINPTLFGRENVRNLFNIVGNLLYDKAMELDMASYNALHFNDKYNSGVSTPADLVPLVRNAINDQVGSEIVGLNAVHSIVDKAIEKGHSAFVTPVILNTEDEKFALDLVKNLKKRKQPDGTTNGLSDKVFLVIAGKPPKALAGTEGAILVKTVSEENVGEALAAIRTKILL